jgi:hypothetical protein
MTWQKELARREGLYVEPALRPSPPSPCCANKGR